MDQEPLKEANKVTNKGLARPCPECKKSLIMAAEMVGFGHFEYNMKCAYCGVRVRITIGQKPFVTVTKLVVLILLVAFSYQLFLVSKLNVTLTSLMTNYEFNVSE